MGDDTDRTRRKHEHIEAVKALADQGGTGFDDVVLLPVSAPELNLAEITLETQLLGKTLASPIIINAMTGGTEEARVINRRLAEFARRNGLAMAVGSETAALQSVRQEGSYTVVRDTNPSGVLIANVGMGADADAAQRAVDLIGADFLQIHWNVAQELFMAEGDRDFFGMLDRLREVASSVSVPVIAKEVGQGMTGVAARRFVAAGAQAIDIGGMGGTNFIAVEAWRRGRTLDREWKRWGVPTAASLGEVAADLGLEFPIIASGGLRTGHDVAKAIAMGASAVGIAGPLMRLVIGDSPDAELDTWIQNIHWTIRMILVLMGARKVAELKQRPLIITGRTAQWLDVRGYAEYLRAVARRQPGVE